MWFYTVFLLFLVLPFSLLWAPQSNMRWANISKWIDKWPITPGLGPPTSHGALYFYFLSICPRDQNPSSFFFPHGQKDTMYWLGMHCTRSLFSLVTSTKPRPPHPTVIFFLPSLPYYICFILFLLACPWKRPSLLSTAAAKLKNFQSLFRSSGDMLPTNCRGKGDTTEKGDLDLLGGRQKDNLSLLTPLMAAAGKYCPHCKDGNSVLNPTLAGPTDFWVIQKWN